MTHHALSPQKHEVILADFRQYPELSFLYLPVILDPPVRRMLVPSMIFARKIVLSRSNRSKVLFIMGGGDWGLVCVGGLLARRYLASCGSLGTLGNCAYQKLSGPTNNFI